MRIPIKPHIFSYPLTSFIYLFSKLYLAPIVCQALCSVLVNWDDEEISEAPLRVSVLVSISSSCMGGHFWSSQTISSLSRGIWTQKIKGVLKEVVTCVLALEVWLEVFFVKMLNPHQVVNGPDDSWDSWDRKEPAVFGELKGEIGKIEVLVSALGDEEPFNDVRQLIF